MPEAAVGVWSAEVVLPSGEVVSVSSAAALVVESQYESDTVALPDAMNAPVVAPVALPVEYDASIFSAVASFSPRNPPATAPAADTSPRAQAARIFTLAPFASPTKPPTLADAPDADAPPKAQAANMLAALAVPSSPPTFAPPPFAPPPVDDTATFVQDDVVSAPALASPTRPPMFWAEPLTLPVA